MPTFMYFRTLDEDSRQIIVRSDTTFLFSKAYTTCMGLGLDLTLATFRHTINQHVHECLIAGVLLICHDLFVLRPM